jgi:polysaccharide biosynthesis protein PslG
MSTARLLRLTAAVAAAICLAVPAAASARAPRAFYGVMTAQDPSTAELARMGTGKVGIVRINLAWSGVQASPNGPYNWDRYDTIIGDAARAGVQVLPILYSSPNWAASKPNYEPQPQWRGAFQAFAKAAAERYGTNGIYWTFHPEIPKTPIMHWQVWNEVNSPSFWGPDPPNAADYVDLLRAAHDGIKAGDPQGKVMLAGLFLTPRIHNGIFLKKYLPQIYRAGGKPLFDEVAVHPYSVSPRDALSDVRDVRKITRRFGDKQKPLWLTEIGWSTGGVPNTALTTTPKGQARYVTQTYGLMAANRNRLNIGGVVWYSWRDEGSSVWFDHTGLFTQGFDPKPAWRAYVRASGGSY